MCTFSNEFLKTPYDCGLLSKVLFIGLAWMETDFLTVSRPRFWLIRGFSITCPNLNVCPRCTHDIVCFICSIILWLQQYLRHRLLRARSCLQLFAILMLTVCRNSHDYTILPYISSIFNRNISRKTGLFTETLLPVMSSLAMATRSKWQTLGWWDRYMKMYTAQGSLKNFLWSGWPQNHFIKAFTQPKVMCELTITTSGQGNHFLQCLIIRNSAREKVRK